MFVSESFLTTYLVLELGVLFPIVQVLSHYCGWVHRDAHQYLCYHRNNPASKPPSQDPGLLYHIVCRRGEALEHVQDPTPQLCLLAVIQEARALQFVPPHLRTYEVQRAAWTNGIDESMQ